MTNEQIDELLADNMRLIAASRNNIRELAGEVKRLRETWRCFHCNFETSDKTEAAGHFGEYGEEHPLCIAWGQLSDQEKANEIQKIAGQLAKSKEENRTLRSTIEGLEYRVDGVAAEIFSRFKGCRTIDEAWHNYDFMEGRALAAEEEVKRLRAENERLRGKLKTGSLLREPSSAPPPGCYCKPGRCMAPKIMGVQVPCRDPQKAACSPDAATADIRTAAAELESERPALRTYFTSDGQIVTVRDRVED